MREHLSFSYLLTLLESSTMFLIEIMPTIGLPITEAIRESGTQIGLVKPIANFAAIEKLSAEGSASETLIGSSVVTLSCRFHPSFKVC